LFLLAACLWVQWTDHKCRLGETGSQDFTPSVRVGRRQGYWL